MTLGGNLIYDIYKSFGVDGESETMGFQTRFVGDKLVIEVCLKPEINAVKFCGGE